MSEPTNLDDVNELGTLRNLRTELLAKIAKRDARIAELEGEAAKLTERADKAVATMRAAVIDAPMKKLAAEVSNVPELWLAELMKDYTIEAAEDGTLVLKNKDNEIVKDSAGKPLELAHNSLYRLLTDEKNERARIYTTIMRYSGAAGGVGRKPTTSHPGAQSSAPETKPSFGLR